MAGIGFELKRLFKRKGIFSTISAGVYATMVTIGPTIIVVLALNIMYLMPTYAEMTYLNREVLSLTILYIFIFSLILVSGINILLSKFMADRIYEEDYTGISSAVDTGNLLIAIIAAVAGIPFGCAMYFVGHLPFYYIVIAYVCFCALSFTFFYMSIITIMKEYRKISFSFLGSFALGIMLAWALVHWNIMEVRDAILFSLATGFVLIAILLAIRTRHTFPVHGKNSWDLLRELKKKNMPLVVANVLYIIALYLPNFVFWFLSDYSVVTVNVFISAPPYDMASFLAVMSNLPVLVVFVVNVETKFHTAYQTYCEAIVGAGDKDIRRAKRDMIETLRRETLYIIQLQAIVNILVYLGAIALLPRLGIDGMILVMYPVLSIAYMIIYLTQCMMIYLYYLDDAPGAAVVGVVLVVGALLGSLVAVHLPPAAAGLGAAFGALCGFTTAFFRIRHILVHLDSHIFGRGQIVPRVRRRNAREYDLRVWRKEQERLQ